MDKAKHKADDKKDEKNCKYNSRDTHCRAGDSGKAQQPRDQRNH